MNTLEPKTANSIFRFVILEITTLIGLWTLLIVTRLLFESPAVSYWHDAMEIFRSGETVPGVLIMYGILSCLVSDKPSTKYFRLRYTIPVGLVMTFVLANYFIADEKVFNFRIFDIEILNYVVLYLSCFLLSFFLLRPLALLVYMQDQKSP